jgi:carbamoyltransferase
LIILGLYHHHDACAALYDDYACLASVALERVTRIKTDGGRFPTEAIDECLASAGLKGADVDAVVLPRVSYELRYFKTPHLRWGIPPWRRRYGPLRVVRRGLASSVEQVMDTPKLLATLGLRDDARTYFYNHHAAHALATLFHTTWPEAMLYTADGGGDHVVHSARLLRDGRLTELFGGDADTFSRPWRQTEADSLGTLYALVTEALGFKRLRHEGKVLGLAAFGSPVHADALRSFYRVTDEGGIKATAALGTIKACVKRLAASTPRENLAASVQQTLEIVMLEALDRLLARHPSRHLGLSGGVFANVKLTQRIAERFPLDEVFVFPAMSDQGEADGGVLEFLLARDGIDAWLARRSPLADVYRGRDYMDEADAAFAEGGAVRIAEHDVAAAAAAIIAEGGIVGTFLGRMEYGPRALGARSIMARANDRGINDWLNTRLARTEFMPFAPVVRAERVDDLFLLPPSLHYTANFMTVTCDVHPEWRDRIPAIVHVDGTARPQIIHRAQNPTYYDILHAYERLSGIPALINTSFNVHEEPIINRPEEALRALLDKRVDYLVTESSLWRRGG